MESMETCDTTRQESVAVAVRVRPLMAKERGLSEQFWTFPSSESIKDSNGKVYVFGAF